MNAAGVRRHIEFKVSVRELDQAVARRMLDALAAGGPAHYGLLLERATFLSPPATCFHTAPVTARGRILSEGLRPGGGQNWGGDAIGQPDAVYLGAEPDLRGLWSHWPIWDVWAVDMTGLTWAHDRLNPGHWHVPAVPPSALTLSHRDLTYPSRGTR